MPDSKAIVETAMQLRAMAPDIWPHFLEAMKGYALEVQRDFVKSAPELLQRSQGMAWQANEIAEILANAPALQEKFQGAALRRATQLRETYGGGHQR